MNFTPEQHRAIFTHDQNLIVIAGAGSGKTRVLVERYLAMLDSHPNWKLTDLVAITFTEKAAREMRDRVRLTIQQRIAETQDRRWRVHESLLDNARIGTIHSLCAQILRANPAEVPVDPKFEVLDEVEAGILRRDAVEKALVRLVEEEHPSRELLLVYNVKKVRDVLVSFAGLGDAEAFSRLPHTAEALIAQWETEREKAVQESITALRCDEDFLTLLHSNDGWQELGERVFRLWQVVAHNIPALLHGTADEVYAALQEIAQLRMFGGRVSDDVAEARAILTLIRDTAKDYLKGWAVPLTEQDQEAARLILLWKDAVQLAGQSYRDLKNERNVLDFDDLEVLTVRLLAEYPHVARRYAIGEFRHLMIDEFQDTNPNQRMIAYRLCGLVIPEQQATTLPQDRPEGGRLFVVGDPKQSIYAFRGADVRVFNAVHRDILAMGGIDVPLSQSFRTHAGLVGAFNDLFKALLYAKSPYEVDFGEPMSAFRPAAAHHQTALHLCLMEKPDGEKLSTDEMRRWEAYEIASLIQQWVQVEKRLVWDREQNIERPMQYGDVALLFRSFTHTSDYEDTFKRLGLPYVTIGGRGYYNRQEVWDLINLLKALHNPADSLALASALRSPLFGLSDDALFALRLWRNEQNERLSLWDALLQNPADAPFPIPAADLPALDFARDTLMDLRRLAGRVTVAELLTAILDATAYDATLTALSDGDRRRGNVEKLLLKARESGRIGLGEFTAYLGDLTAADPREGEAALESGGSIKLMTVHRSKGLEFPVVVIPEAGRNKQPNFSQPLVYDPEIGAACTGDHLKEAFAYQRAKALERQRDDAESKRLFYVAATRAQDYLVLAGECTTNSWMGLFCEALEVPQATGLYDRHWGSLQVNIATQPPPDQAARQTVTTGWDHLAHDQHIAVYVPPLAQPAPRYEAEPARHLSVTHLEQLGSIPAFDPPGLGRQLFRNSVLHDAPPPIRPIEEDGSYVVRRTIGRIVHRALQVGAWSQAREKLHPILRAYAWDEGLTDRARGEQVVQEALRLLAKFEEPATLRDADQVFREMPFVHQTGGRIIHGVIDVLYRSGEQWYVLDYKTALVKAERAAWHAQRYYLQVGAYAQAVAAETGSLPQVQLYYLHPGTLVTVAEEQWRNALDHLEDDISGALGR